MNMDLNVLVVDDMRELPHKLVTSNTVHCKTNEEVSEWLSQVGEEPYPIIVILDHDAGGEAFGLETFREGISLLLEAHTDERLDIIMAYIVTMNPPGRLWIQSELENAGIDYDVDPAGRQLGMKCPDGWG